MKMLSRVTPFQRSPPKLKEEQERDMSSVSVLESEYKDYTNDITDCPLTQFAVVYAALIHDCDHAGVSNDQLIREGARIAEIYRNKSVAENHSFNLALDYLMQPEFEGIVSCMCGPENPQAEFERFSGILQNAVLATDVFDKEIKSQRDARWENVFGELNSEEDQDVLNYLRAQIVLEHMIQASDVIHTMQHVSWINAFAGVYWACVPSSSIQCQHSHC
jgi:3'5'-cyclic nucleotide phosphodiesterase